MDRLYYLFVVWVFTILSLSSALEAAPATAKPLNLGDIFRIEETTEPQFSPDGQQIVYTRIFSDIETDRKYSNLWIVGIDGQQHLPLTQGRFYDKRPRWSPDGKRILFSSNRGKGDQAIQLFTLDVATQQLTQLTKAPTAPRAHNWSPNGQYISYIALVEKPASSLINLTAPSGAEWTKPPIFIDKLHYRFYGQYVPNGEDHLFIVQDNGGTPRQVTPSGQHYSLSPHRTTVPVWSADSRSIIFSSNLNLDREFQPFESNLYRITIDKGEISQLAPSEGPQYSPVISPDGTAIAYLGYQGPGYQHVTQIYVLTNSGQQPHLLTDRLDRSVRQLQWSADGEGLYFLYDDHGNTKLGYQPIKGDYRVLANDIGSMTLAYASGSYDVSVHGHAVITHSRPYRIGELLLVPKTQADQLRNLHEIKNERSPLVSVNANILSNRALGKVEEFQYPSSIDGLPIQGWIIKPPNFDATKRYPLIVNIHGGPNDNLGNRFSLMMQLMAAKGYVVLYTNPRGSSGYGEKFVDIIQQKAYPGKDFHDINSGVEVLLQRDYIDEENLFITGFSYGGTLTCWVIAKSNMYRAAVPIAPVANWLSATLTTEAPVLYSQLSGGLPWEKPDSYLNRSPLSLVGQVITPTLLITGEVDYRNPISETEAYYMALKLKKIDVAMLRLQDADHFFFRKPSNLMHTIGNTIAWFDRFKERQRETGVR